MLLCIIYFHVRFFFLFTLFLIADIYFNKCPALNMDASQNII